MATQHLIVEVDGDNMVDDKVVLDEEPVGERMHQTHRRAHEDISIYHATTTTKMVAISR